MLLLNGLFTCEKVNFSKEKSPLIYNEKLNAETGALGSLTGVGFCPHLQTQVQSISGDVLQPAAGGRHEADLCWKPELCAAFRGLHPE